MAAIAVFLAAVASARESPAPGGWSARFNRHTGENAAIYRASDGSTLSFVCDSAGPRPGRGRIEAVFVLKEPPAELPSHTSLHFMAGGESLLMSAAAKMSAVPLPPRAAKDLQPRFFLNAAIPLDGAAARSIIMTDVVALIQKSVGDISLRVQTPPLLMTIKPAGSQRALKGFADGCRNFLPAADDEVIWDWHQGLGLRDGKRSITLVAQTLPNEARLEAGRLTLLCYDGAARVTIAGLSGSGVITTEIHAAGEGISGTFPVSSETSPQDLAVAENRIKSFLSLLDGQDVFRIAPVNDKANVLVFNTAGFSLAARLLRQECPEFSP